MTAKSRRTSRKPRLSDEARAARREAEAALIEAANARLAGEEAGAELADFIRARPALARLSLKNLALLAEQAEERGTDVTNVQTFQTWQLYGRQVRKGARAYKLTVPYRREEKKAEGEQAPEAKPEEGKKKPPRFYLKAGWFDIADTEGLEAFEPGDQAPAPVPADEGEAAAAMFAALTEQAERAGYHVEEIPAEDAEAGAAIDHDAATVQVYAPRPDADADTAWAALARFTAAVNALQQNRREDRADDTDDPDTP
jgi:hypothetical protein